MHFRRADHDLQRHSYYADTAVRDAEHAALMGDASCDVAVVGGGLAGLSAAIELADRGLSVRLLEAGQIGSGASGRNSHAWGGFVDITMNRAPDFGRLPDAPQVYYLQGFSGHGLALTGLAGQLVVEAMTGDSHRFDTFARLRHRRFPGGPRLRTPTLVLGMAWHRLKDALA